MWRCVCQLSPQERIPKWGRYDLLSPFRDGDHYDALRDCLKAISLNPCHLKAHFRLARCLFELKYVAEALECLDDFKGKFPEQAHSSACDALDRDINAALFSKSDNGGN